jgi:hypothetical protein
LQRLLQSCKAAQAALARCLRACKGMWVREGSSCSSALSPCSTTPLLDVQGSMICGVAKSKGVVGSGGVQGGVVRLGGLIELRQAVHPHQACPRRARQSSSALLLSSQARWSSRHGTKRSRRFGRCFSWKSERCTRWSRSKNWRQSSHVDMYIYIKISVGSVYQAVPTLKVELTS